MEEAGFQELMRQQAYLHDQLCHVHNCEIWELQEEVRSLRARLNCALLTGRRNTDPEISNSVRRWTQCSESSSASRSKAKDSSASRSNSKESQTSLCISEPTVQGQGGRRSNSKELTDAHGDQRCSTQSSTSDDTRYAIVRKPTDESTDGEPVPLPPGVPNQIPVEVAPEDASPDAAHGSAAPDSWMMSSCSDSAATLQVVPTDPAPGEQNPNPAPRRSADPGSRRVGITLPDEDEDRAKRSPSMGRRSVVTYDSNAFDNDPPPAMRSPSRRPSRVGLGLTIGATRTFGGRDDQGNFEPWPIWLDVCEFVKMEGTAEPDYEQQRRLTRINRTRKLARSMDFHQTEIVESVLGKCVQGLVHHPSSLSRLTWVCLGMVLIVYDLIMLPMGAFEPYLSMDAFNRSFLYVIAIFWSLDTIVNFFVAFHTKGGALEMRVRKIAGHYLRTWFCIDFALVCIDWSCIIVSETEMSNVFMTSDGASSSGTARIIKPFRAMRTLRSIRLLRVVKMPGVLNEITMSIGRTEYASLSLGIVKHLFSILIVNHVLACLWFLIGKDTGGWIHSYHATRNSEDWAILYFTSLHWCLAQFTPAPLSIEPQNLPELIYTVVVIVFALIIFSSFVSSITNLMNHLRSLRSVEAKQFSKLERYLRDNHISFHLSLRIRRFLEHSVYEAKRMPQEKDVELLQKLSEPLRMELHYEVHGPVISKHPFFKHYIEINLPATQKLCHDGIRPVQLSGEDIMFNTGESAKAIYFVTTGELEYFRGGLIGKDPEPVDEGMWFSEMVLWTAWSHRGVMKSTSQCILSAIDAESLHDVVASSKAGQLEASAYAVEAVRVLTSESDSSSHSDLDGGCYDAHKISSKIFKHIIKANKQHWLRTGRHDEGDEARPSTASRVSEKVRSFARNKMRVSTCGSTTSNMSYEDTRRTSMTSSEVSGDSSILVSVEAQSSRLRQVSG